MDIIRLLKCHNRTRYNPILKQLDSSIQLQSLIIQVQFLQECWRSQVKDKTMKVVMEKTMIFCINSKWIPMSNGWMIDQAKTMSNLWMLKSKIKEINWVRQTKEKTWKQELVMLGLSLINPKQDKRHSDDEAMAEVQLVRKRILVVANSKKLEVQLIRTGLLIIHYLRELI